MIRAGIVGMWRMGGGCVTRQSAWQCLGAGSQEGSEGQQRRWKAARTVLPEFHVSRNNKLQHELAGGKEVEMSLVCGMALLGSEVKSLRNNMCDITAAFVEARRTARDRGTKEKNGMELWMHQSVFGLFRPPYFGVHDIHRERKLLVKKKEVEKIKGFQDSGKRVVPLRVFFDSSGYAKVEIVVLSAQKKADRRHLIDKKDWSRNKPRISY